MSSAMENPFWVQTPESMPAEEALHLFVNIFSEFGQVESTGHSFITGPRGSGKSMMFRMMRPDCLTLRKNCSLRDLPYLGVYVPIKSPRIAATEIARLDEHPGRHAFNEHLLCLYIAIAAFHELGRTETAEADAVEQGILRNWLADVVCNRLSYCGASEADVSRVRKLPCQAPAATFSSLGGAMDELFWSIADNLLRALGFQPDKLSRYEGPLFSYQGFLLPVLKSLRDLPWFPKEPIYLLIDDADNLNVAQTEVINSWISTRSTEGVCLKLSDQMGYKTWLTFAGKRIQSPHDYNEVDISVLYTTQREKYLERLEEIVTKRLALAKIEVPPRVFFPPNANQESLLQEIATELKEAWAAGQGHGHRQRDDVARYTRPELIRRLGGDRRQRSTYSYAGFEQLAHISSGVVRYFLEPAATMFVKQKTLQDPVLAIEPNIQDDVIKDFSNDFLDKDLVIMRKDAGSRAGDYEKLLNLIEVMGNSFADRLLDTSKTERRVFSIALSDRPDPEVQRILDLGTREGFLYRSSLGAKRGAGRVPRYVLSRRLAPRFKLDPTSFAGYLFVTSQALRAALANPNSRFRESAESGSAQLELGMTEGEGL